jgi:hypothetical protein
MKAARKRLLPMLSLGGSILAFFVSAPGAGATTIHLSQFSSESNPSPAVLDATLLFMVTGPSQLTLTATNDTAAPNAYRINGIWWNAAAHVMGLTLQSATHSQTGDVTAAWTPVLTDSHVAGFGSFDFGVTGGVGGQNPNLLGSGQSLSFVFTIAGTGPFDMADFDVLNEKGMSAAAKFVSGPEDLSTFGAVPEPASAALVGTGLLGIALARARRRRAS